MREQEDFYSEDVAGRHFIHFDTVHSRRPPSIMRRAILLAAAAISLGVAATAIIPGCAPGQAPTSGVNPGE